MKKPILMILAAGLFTFTFASCDTREENTQERVEDTAEDVGNDVEDAADEVEDEAKDVVQ
ncbi:hypothetical protein K3G39_12430 [Pontibacter sp. HSC-14F20]|uniref:hypothetical protein n=1 Tax=Pontibacter sp. HSC-14F20 TaxID=2864136 RepID=UPI001C72F73D|nr:hypothetical protein [Pontibacter sp. HSC-14F20]MBX0334045.1 hypothetical protein [Pontibacter sp. HSC-14F20]